MNSKKTAGRDPNELRRRAEEIDRERIRQTPEVMEALSPEAAWKLIHELRVHQIELEMQNEELRGTQAQLEDSHLRYFDLYDLAPVGYLTINDKGLILESNLAFSTMVGVDRRALLKQPLSRFVLPEDCDYYYLQRKKLIKTGTTQVSELRLVKPGGGQLWIRMEENLEDRSPSGGGDIRCIVSDINERKQAEDALRESEAKYRQLFEMEADALFLIDAQSGKILDTNAAAVDLYGYSRDELLQKRHVDLSAEPEETEKASNSAGTSGVVVIPVRYHRKKDGTVFPVEIKSTSLIWKGRPAILPAIRDITERKLSEEAIKSSEARYRALVEQSSEAQGLVDIETREVVEVNRRYTELFGYSLPEDSPLFANKVLVDSERNIDRLYDITLKQQRILPREEIVFRSKNGSLVLVERAGTVLHIDGRNYLLASLRDISDERKRQLELAQDVELARRVQRELLPELPPAPFVAIRTIYHPSKGVSGDSYYLEWRNKGKLLRGFLIDITGHGVGTALQTSSFTVLLREASIGKLPLLKQAQWLNERAKKYFAEGSFAALVGFELDLATKELRYIGAGITQFYANGRKIVTPGMNVGMFDAAEFEIGVVPVSVGDTFCFLTDGFTDILNQPQNADFFSPKGKDFAAAVAALEKLASDGSLRDDATGVCLKVEALPVTRRGKRT